MTWGGRTRNQGGTHLRKPLLSELDIVTSWDKSSIVRSTSAVIGILPGTSIKPLFERPISISSAISPCKFYLVTYLKSYIYFSH
jgi:hypothetical protein